MLRLTKSLDAWGSAAFGDVLKQEIEELDKQLLPLQQGLTLSSYVTDRPIQAMILNVTELDMTKDGARIRVRAGIFYTGVIAGCNCADDPSPVDELNEYCVLQFDIDSATAESTVLLLAD